MADFSPHQQKIIKRYYRNFDAIKHQRLSELTTELYLAEGKKSERLWKQVADTLTALEFPASRIEHLLQKKDPALLPGHSQGARIEILNAFKHVSSTRFIGHSPTTSDRRRMASSRDSFAPIPQGGCIPSKCLYAIHGTVISSDHKVDFVEIKIR